jgi:adenine-specific DNA-methyltransferase
MPTLNWIAKDKVINHDKDLPFRVLKPNPKLSVGDGSDNLLIQGDNLEALKSLMPFYYNKVKCIYIDPPYNTGNDKWIYSDRVNAPQIKSWLNKVVGSEGEDLCRHDKWLCMMYPRLKLLRDLLRQDGAIFVSIDDNEQHNLRMVMDELFGAKNFVSNIVWQKKYTQSNDAKYFSNTHDFIVVYAKNKDLFKLNLLNRTEAQNARYMNPDNDPRGVWMTQPLHAKSGNSKSFEYTFKNGKKWVPPNGTFPRFSIESLKKAEEENRIWFGAAGTAVPRLKKYLTDMKEGVISKTIWLYDEVGSNDDARRQLKAIFPENPFDTPKPVGLIKRIVEIASGEDDIILDSFSGSGTTGQAVLELNKVSGNRKFILVELENHIAENITSERLRRVISGYKGGEFDEGTGGSFEYLDLNGELFDSNGFINPKAEYEDLASYIFYTETNSYVDLKGIRNPFIGSMKNISYYLIFNGQGKNVLDEKVAKNLASDEQSVIYADKCLVDDEQLGELNIVFKQIPYELKKY